MEVTFFEEPALAGAAKTRAAKAAPNIGQAFKVRSIFFIVGMDVGLRQNHHLNPNECLMFYGHRLKPTLSPKFKV